MAKDDIAVAATQIHDKNDRIHLKRQVSLFSGCSIIIGVIVGSGIFVSPKGVLAEAGSVGVSLIIWFLSGIFATMGAFCYAELGTTIPKSGADYTYLSEVLGPFPAFLFMWMALIIIDPATNAIMALTCAEYALKPFFADCQMPTIPIQLLAASIICFLTWINCVSVKFANMTQNAFTVAKMASLCVIIGLGIAGVATGQFGNSQLPKLFDKSDLNAGHLALALYSGIFSFSGWNSLNSATEELINPNRNLPLAIFISMPAVTIIYLLVNLSYFSVLTIPEIIQSPAVAVTLAEKVVGKFSVIMPILVSISCAGGLNAVIFAASRMFYVGARKGQLPEILSMISINYITPLPSLLILLFISLIMLIPSNIFLLINYVTFSETLVITLSSACLIKLRISKPSIERPIKFWIALPISFFIICLFLLILPFFTQPYEMLIGAAIIFTGVPFYFIFVVWKNKPAKLLKIYVKLTHSTQKLLNCVPEDEHID